MNLFIKINILKRHSSDEIEMLMNYIAKNDLNRSIEHWKNNKSLGIYSR